MRLFMILFICLLLYIYRNITDSRCVTVKRQVMINHSNILRKKREEINLKERQELNTIRLEHAVTHFETITFRYSHK